MPSLYLQIQLATLTRHTTQSTISQGPLLRIRSLQIKQDNLRRVVYRDRLSRSSYNPNRKTVRSVQGQLEELDLRIPRPLNSNRSLA